MGILLHPARPEAIDVAEKFVQGTIGTGITCVGFGDRIAELRERVRDVMADAAEHLRRRRNARLPLRRRDRRHD